MFFQNKVTVFEQWHKEPQKAKFQVFGCTEEHWPLIFSLAANDQNRHHQLLVCQTVEQAELLAANLIKFQLKVLFYPEIDHDPYSTIIPSEQDLIKRHNVLGLLGLPIQKRLIIVTTIKGLLLKCPSISELTEYSFSIQKDDIIAPLTLAGRLIQLGYRREAVADEPGTFALKGELFDLYPIAWSHAVRIQYFDDLIEIINGIDAENNRTDRNTVFEDIFLLPSHKIILSEEGRANLRASIPMPPPSHKNRFEKRKEIFAKLSNGQLFDNYPLFYPNFFSKNSSLLHEFSLSDGICHLFDPDNSFRAFESYLRQLQAKEKNYHSDFNDGNVIPSPDQIYTDLEMISHYSSTLIEYRFGESDLQHNQLSFGFIPLKRHFDIKPNLQHNHVSDVLSMITTKMEHDAPIYLVYQSSNSLEEIKYLLDLQRISSDKIKFIQGGLHAGFTSLDSDMIAISDSDLFSYKQNRASNKKRKQETDLFAEQMSTLKVGDFVIHKEHGIGLYKGLEKINTNGFTSDFLIIEYEDKDKIYLPVYKLDLISKHSDAGSGIRADSLRNDLFKKIKEKARLSAKKLAFDLIELQAKRNTTEAFAFSPPDKLFKDFELGFPFQETPDQINAIETVLEAMQKPHPMDNLVCGDVGFGKTEVAMRAAFKAVLDHKQVAILVPTTILALQHYNSFCNRFKNFPVTIEFISRFKTPKEESLIKAKTAVGEVDILIGTHKLLSESIKFKDLGLVVVDEEQRFGVGHKEKLKLMKASVDFLTLTATPIPRTLQMAFMGIRELSLIQTAPPKRQAIKTYFVNEDEQTIKNAIELELERGGQVYYLYNKVNDIELIHEQLMKLVPKAKIIVGHGQLPERELENRMKDFYQQKGNLLLCTTIIESGIDIPTANTLIVHNAQNFGLSQLHQLRGRIGRSDRKAYAYFVVPSDKVLSSNSDARLKALQTYADIGSGFSIASCDLEIRGAGELLGADQSGHIDSIGLELYTRLLDEAISDLKGTPHHFPVSIEITTEHTALLPEKYIPEPSIRLKYYKRISNCYENSKLAEIQDELFDIYGRPTIEVSNLFYILSARNYLQNVGIIKIQQAGKVVTFWFNPKLLSENESLKNRVVTYFLSKPKLYRFTPDYKVIHSGKEIISPTLLVEISKDIAHHLELC